MVSVLAFYSYDPSSNPADAYSFSLKFVCEKKKIINKKYFTCCSTIMWKTGLEVRAFGLAFTSNTRNLQFEFQYLSLH